MTSLSRLQKSLLAVFAGSAVSAVIYMSAGSQSERPNPYTTPQKSWPGEKPSSPSPSAGSTGTTEAAVGSGQEATRPVPTARVEAEIGAEGYGPHIEAALASRNPEAAWKGLNWIKKCALNQEVLEGIYNIRSRQGIPAEAVKLHLEMAEADARRCQTVTPQIAETAPMLSRLAMEGGVPGAAAEYMRQAKFKPDDALSGKVAAALKADTLAGDAISLQVLVTFGDVLNLTAVESRAYQIAQKAVSPSPMPFLADFKISYPLSRSDEEAAKTLADQLVSSIRTKRKQD